MLGYWFTPGDKRASRKRFYVLVFLDFVKISFEERRVLVTYGTV